ncbi:MAG: hypothetical protein AAF799_02635 [Myxococcota bacterium]
MLRFVALIGLALAASFSCSLDDALANAPCESNDDCLGAYTCVKTVHNSQVGLCRDDGQCAVGQQEGCSTNGDGTCDNFLTSVCSLDNPQDCYCCPSGTDLVAVDAASGTAACIGNEIQNEPCDGDAACGAGFTCTRTLEQEAESAEAETRKEEQEEEDGWCRPDSDPGCAVGAQPGCTTDGGCSSGTEQVDTAEGRSFCCERPTASGFSVHVYAVAGDGSSAACVECPSCDSGTPCTELEDTECIVTSGVCGCAPSN